jgi:nitrate/TMAO reductase-like tetraheme cytochrome c subunit
MIHNFLSMVTRNWISLLGAIIALVGAVLMLMLFGMEMSGFHGGPYLGILTYLILPTIFVIGLALIPVGVIRKRRQDAAAAASHKDAPHLPIIDLNDEKTRGVVIASVLVGVVSMVLLAGATYKGVEVMESVEFCGEACHTVMEPEYTAFKRSAHSRLACADCHIGSGADWFVKAKISGAWQLVAVAFNLYPTPIPAPVHSLRPARETCEQCHWPTKHVGDKLALRTHFGDDETNTETKTVLLMKVGGLQGRSSSGIHWHVDPSVSVRYLSDMSRQKIYDIEARAADGTTKVFKTNEKPEGKTEWRKMDCVDCHNRPSHTYKMPSTELDAALDDGRIDKTLPFIKREGMRMLQVAYPSHDAARAALSSEVATFYKTSYSDIATSKAAEIAAAGKTLGDIYSWNVFPQMKVTWGTYRNNLGHDEDSPGCFRCHDKRHATDKGKKIGRDCEVCHSVLAENEEDPEIIKQLNP